MNNPTFATTRHRYADETDHKCTGTGVCGYCKPNGFNGTAGEVGSTPDQDPYEVQGKECKVLKETGGHYFVKGSRVCCVDENIEVNHPVQPKTQVERWREEIEENERVVKNHCGLFGGELKPKDCEDCVKRLWKIHELGELISQATQPIHPRYPTGTFADDIENAPEYIKKSLFGNNFRKVTLLDKIKLWLKK